jgi:hypothetical protein
MEKLVLEVQLSKEEFVRARRLILLKTNFRWFDPLICAVLIGYGAFDMLSGQQSWYSILFVVIGLLYFAVMAVTFGIMPGVLFRREEKFRAPYKITFSAEQVTYESQHGRQELEWSFYKKAVRAGEFYFLIYGYQLANVIPWRVFKDEAEIQAFEAMVRAQINDSF